MWVPRRTVRPRAVHAAGLTLELGRAATEPASAPRVTIRHDPIRVADLEGQVVCRYRAAGQKRNLFKSLWARVARLF